jgi:hypothetical protein
MIWISFLFVPLRENASEIRRDVQFLDFLHMNVHFAIFSARETGLERL